MKIDPYDTLMSNQGEHILILFINNTCRHNLATVLIANAARLVSFVMHVFNILIQIKWLNYIMGHNNHELSTINMIYSLKNFSFYTPTS